MTNFLDLIEKRFPIFNFEDFQNYSIIFDDYWITYVFILGTSNLKSKIDFLRNIENLPINPYILHKLKLNIGMQVPNFPPVIDLKRLKINFIFRISSQSIDLMAITCTFVNGSTGSPARRDAVTANIEPIRKLIIKKYIKNKTMLFLRQLKIIIWLQ